MKVTRATRQGPPAASTESVRRLRTLVVVPLSIHPPIHGGAVRITNLLRRLATRHDVSVLLILGGNDAPDHRAALVPPCHEVLVHPLGGDGGLAGRELWPPLARPFASSSLADRITALVHGRGFDLVQLEFTQLGGLVAAARPASVVLVEHDLSFRSHSRQRRLGLGRSDAGSRILGRGRLDSTRLLRFELGACAHADQVHVMSADDRDELTRQLGDGRHIRVIPNGVDTTTFVPPMTPENRDGVLMLGSFPHLPNYDAFDWAVREIWPLIRRDNPAAELTVAGARPPAEVFTHDGRDGIRIVGEVDDVGPLLTRHRVLLVPLRSGSGSRLKILEALACGLPVVTTTIGAEGLGCRHDTHLLVADDSRGLAAAVARLLADDGTLAERLARSGRELVRAHFDWDPIARAAEQGWLAATARNAASAPRLEVSGAAAQHGEARSTAVVITLLADEPRLAEVCGAVEQQTTAAPIERVIVDARPDPAGPVERSGWRTVACAAARGLQGPALDTGMRVTAAHAVAFLAADAIPVDSDWLRRLTAPLQAERPPAAVQGAIWEQPAPGGVRLDLAATAETRHWIATFGLRFDVGCAAVRREAWRQAPFGPWGRLAELRWQRIGHQCGWLILPCWDAAAVRVRRRPLSWWWRELRLEAWEWRDLGASYGLKDAVGDLAWPRLAPHRHGWLPLLGRHLRHQSHAHLAWLRPVALLTARRRSPRRTPL